MKILIVDRASAFSIWTLMDAIAAEARAEGFEVAYCRLDDGEPGAPPAPEGVRLHTIVTPPRRNLTDRAGQWVRFCRRFPGVLRAERPDIVHTNFAVPGVAARLIARAAGVRAVVSTHHETRGSLNPLYRLAVAATDWTAARRVFVSAACARSFGAAGAVALDEDTPPTRARDLVIRNGIATPAIPASGADPEGAPRLAFAGRLMPEKGLGALIDAVGLLRARGVEAGLDIHGDGPERAMLEARAAAVGGIRFQGWTDHAATLAALRDAACLVAPSDGRQEGFGLALAEALVVARRVVASDIPVFREVAEGLSDGVAFARPGDPAALADAIAGALAAPVAPERLAARRAAAAARFDIRRMARIYVRLYRDI